MRHSGAKPISWTRNGTCMGQNSPLEYSGQGQPAKSFEAKKGLRQGDPLSPVLFVMAMEGDTQSVKQLHQQFKIFSEAIRLIANPNKSSCIYFGGVDVMTQKKIMDMLGYSKGELPFRYLGMQCWTIKFLSYAGRAVLIKSVLIAIQTFWAQIFVLPKKIVQFIDTICRRFLWTENALPTRKALIAWEKLCCPKVAGCLNFINVVIWNKATICKLLWNICKQKEKL
ncbi:PREDICTED: uncharacterized protein LOC109225916 [Nicotiana attenuata]|uniref:uncharacterized protein LOC109225916 n=1 Tax=Nicotiana attenuata TaxID=49451 RepID=UPI000905CA0E|nr:PREDICTED: uncharacterized protein LOC109225916 [Nicotiana attenuata]